MIKSYNLNHFTQQCSNDIDLIQLRLWNAAFDAGYASALNKSIIVIHSDDHQHALKEVDAAASALPTGIGPEGLVAIPQRNLFISANEVDKEKSVTIYSLD